MRKIYIVVFCVLIIISLALEILNTDAQAQESDIDVSLTMLAFGMVNIGTTTSLTTTISNLGNADLTVTSLDFTGSRDFARSPGAPTTPFTVAPGASVDVPVDYTPTVARAVLGALWISNDAPDTSFVAVSLSGTGIMCDLNVMPLALDFGVVPMGTPRSLATRVSNFGNDTCTVSSRTLSGSTDFTLNPASPSVPFTVVPAGTVDVRVDYTSSDFVADSGTLTIASDDPAQPQIPVDLSGTLPANACDLTVSPQALDFGAVPRNTTRSRTTTLSNAGSGTLTVTSNDPDATTIPLALSGSGLGAPDIAATPAPLAFGTVKLAQKLTLTLTLSNLGDADLTISEMPMTGSGDFALNPAMPTFPFTVVPGASLEVAVDYLPTVAKAVSAVIWVVSNDPNTGILPVQCTGTGVENPDLAVAPLTLDFGIAIIGTANTLTATLGNQGEGTLLVSALTLTGSTAFTLNGAAPVPPFTIAPGAAVDVAVDYVPADPVTDTATLDIASDDPDTPLVTVTLAGTGVPPVPDCDIDVMPSGVDFGTLGVGTSRTLAITVRNLGNSACTVEALTLEGSLEFTLDATAPIPPLTLAFNESVAVPVVYAPVDGGPDTGVLEISSNDPDEAVVAVTLTGAAPRNPHQDLPYDPLAAAAAGWSVPQKGYCYACHVKRNTVQQRAMSTDICLQCHSDNPVPDPTLVPEPVPAPAATVHASAITGSTRFQYEVKCTHCHNPHENSSSQGWQQIKYVKDFVFIPSLEVTDWTRNPSLTLSKQIANYVRFTSQVDFAYTDPNPYIRGICNTCHTQTNYHCNETLNPTGLCDTTHNASTNCTMCHTHKNGFFPAGGCPKCHNQPQGSRRQIVAAGGDFAKTSHHVNGTPQADDCTVCHYTGEHGGGTVKLKDPDQGLASIYDYNPADPAGLEAFCLNCHDADGAVAGNGTHPSVMVRPYRMCGVCPAASGQLRLTS